ncbi:glutathione peroxidase [Shewanella algae]|uniref:glutathione peroxidase n=1 Tax=Shewanella algae TaxID=38313 RepID=UPI003004B28A
MSNSIYAIPLENIQGQQTDLSEFQGRVMLLVNTASTCGFTPQYAGLESLYQEFKDQGLVVLGFPCNQFGAQEKGNEQEIQSFCELNFGVSFPLFAKLEVNGPNAHPLFKLLKQQAPGVLGSKGIKWNFTKFLVDRHGKVIKRYAPTTRPEALREQILQLLQDK